MVWYKEKGVYVLSNVSRSEERLRICLRIRKYKDLEYVVLGSVKGSLKENIEKLSGAGCERQQQHFETMITLANSIIEMGPIVPTQSLAAKYKQIKGSTAKHVTSSKILQSVAKHCTNIH